VEAYNARDFDRTFTYPLATSEEVSLYHWAARVPGELIRGQGGRMK
jgi:hypothetical protein